MPASSSTSRESSGARLTLEGRHAPEVIHHIEGVITGASIDLAEFFAGGEVDLGLELGELYRAGEPSTARIEPSEDLGDLEIAVTPAAGGEPVHRAAVRLRVGA